MSMYSINSIYRSFSFHFIRRYFSYKPKVEDRVLYLTFDDGPEPDITEFVLNQLGKYHAKATFFCCGENCEIYPDLFEEIKKGGHSIGNHSYHHLDGLTVDACLYINDVEKCDTICRSHFFRPPKGVMRLNQLLKLKRKYQIILWDVQSCDSFVESDINIDKIRKMWEQRVKAGCVVLFHFRRKHEKATRVLLPMFLDFFSAKGYVFEKIK